MKISNQMKYKNANKNSKRNHPTMIKCELMQSKAIYEYC